MTAPTCTAWSPPPAPDRDLWWHAQRIAAPDVDDHTTRHRRGVVRLPYDVVGGAAGNLVEAWVCCDPACGGVELGEHVLEINHSCCVYRSLRPYRPLRRHMAGRDRIGWPGYYHGPFTAFWEPGGDL